MAEKNRPVTIAGNWKMHKTISEAAAYVRELAPLIRQAASRICLAVPFTALHAASKEAEGTGIVIGAQNMHDAEEGSFTGEISAAMLKDAGAEFVILGHSERRYIFGEGSHFINRKLKRALEEGLLPVLCVGETGHERETGVAEEVLREQLVQSLEQISGGEAFRIVLAYEPVWAIGTGKTATPEQAQQMHHFCRSFLEKAYGKAVADHVPILYGGSVNPDNIRALLDQTDIDGALVGGASLSVSSFSQIANMHKPQVSKGLL